MSEAMAKREEFEVVFDGDEVADGTMQVRDFAPSLLALGDLFDAVNEVGFENREKISFRVKADFEHGSFHISLELVQSLFQGFVSIFNSEEAAALERFLNIAGITGTLGLIGLVLRTKGKKPTKVIEYTESFKLEYDDSDSVEVPKLVWKLFNHAKARRALESFVKPLKTGVVSKIKLGKKNAQPKVIEQRQSDYFDAPKEKDGETVNESNKRLQLVTIQFQNAGKWKFSDGGSKLSAHITDPEYEKKIANREVNFADGDILDVTLRTTQWQENGDLKAKHEIIKVFAHRPPGAEQMKIRLPNP